jgi:hypothetical protein
MYLAGLIPTTRVKRGGSAAGKRGPRCGWGGVVWGWDVLLREFPPLRAAWSRIGEQAEVIISGRNARSTVVGFLNVLTGRLCGRLGSELEART